MLLKLLKLLDNRARLVRYLCLLFISVIIRASSIVLLLPLLGALFLASSGLLLWAGLFALSIVIGWFVDYQLNCAGGAMGFDLLRIVQAKALDKLERMPLNWLTAERRTQAQKTLTSAGVDLASGFGHLITPLFISVLLPIAIGIGLTFFVPIFGLITLAAVPVLLLSFWGSMRFERKADAAYSKGSDEVSARIVELAKHQALLRTAGRASGQTSSLADALANQRKNAIRLLWYGIPGQLLFSVSLQLIIISLSGFAVYLWLAGELTAGATIAAIVITIRLIDPIMTLAELSAAVESFRASVARLFELLDAPELRVAKTGAAALSDQALVFEKVSFGYQPDHPVLNEVSFSVPVGSTTAIVGPSGSGKSTVLGLVARLFEPNSGDITLFGKPLTGLDPEQSNPDVAIVFQEVYLFAGSLADNIRMGNPGASDAELLDAAERAGLSETIRALPDGLDSEVGEGGVLLSGGERQRVSIARALLKNARLLLLDEATSSLDTVNELNIVAQLAANPDAQTTKLIVTHRLDTIQSADQIIFLSDAQVLEQGSRAELLASGGLFAKFWNNRNQAASWHLS